MAGHPTDLFNNKLTNQEEIHIVYEGPSFNNQIEIKDLRKQLRSTEYLINDLIDELHKTNNLPTDSKNIKIYIKLEKGSFGEIISIVLNNPVVAGIISGVIVALFDYILHKKEKESSEINIENMTNNFLFVKNIKTIISPLHQQGDKVKIRSKANPRIGTEVIFIEKEVIAEYLKELDKKSEYETYEEEFFGHLLQVDLNKDKFGFTLEGSKKVIPTVFESHLNLQEIKDILGERIKITARATYKNNELYRLEILKSEIKNRKNLLDFIGD